MIEVLDEILEAEPLYRIRDKEGNIILDNITLEMVTPVKQIGTPLNKALFTEYAGNILSVSQYNIPMLIVNDSENIIKLNNAISSYEKGMRFLIEMLQVESSFNQNIIPPMTSNNKNGYTTNAPGMFDNNPSTAWTNSWTSSEDWCYINFPIAIKPSKIYLKCTNTRSSSGYVKINGVLADGTEKQILNVSGIATNTSVDTTYSVNMEDFFVGLKITCTSSSSSTSLNIYEINISEGELSLFNSNLKSYLNVNNLGSKEIYGDAIQVGNRHELIYDGEKFECIKIS